MAEEYKISTPKKKIDDRIFDTDIIGQYDAIPFSKGRVAVDLRNIKFVNPYGALGMLILCETILAGFGERADLLLPGTSDGSEIASWLGSLGFLEALQGAANINFPPPFNSHNGPSYIKVSKINSLQDVEKVTVELFYKLQPILIHKLGYREEEGNRAATLISELCSNIYQHSAPDGERPHGYMAMQSYQNSLKMAVMDLGRGIPETVKSKCNSYEGKSDGDIIHSVCREGIPCQGHISLGLYQTLKITKRGEGILNIRSGKAKILFDYRQESSVGDRKIPTPFFSGTQIGIYLPKKEEKKRGLENDFEEGIF